MSNADVNVLVALAIAFGLAGIVVPMMPGTLVIAIAIVAWGGWAGSVAGWTVAAVAVALLALGQVVKYVVPGRRLHDAGVPTSTMLVGAVLGVIGFFVVPVVGLVLGFLLGVYLMQWHHLGRERAWPATWHAVRAIGLGILIEVACGVAAAITWALGLLVT